MRPDHIIACVVGSASFATCNDVYGRDEYYPEILDLAWQDYLSTGV